MSNAAAGALLVLRLGPRGGLPGLREDEPDVQHLGARWDKLPNVMKFSK